MGRGICRVMRERERGGGAETLKTEKAITKQCYLNKSGVGMQIGYKWLKIGSAVRYGKELVLLFQVTYVDTS
jgi:hypothetical protein